MKRLLILAVTSLAVMFGCSENPLMESQETGDPANSADFDQEGAAILLAHRPRTGCAAGMQTYEITIENLTPATGAGASQPFSPPVLTTHGRNLHLFRPQRFASNELAQIAEDAINGPMIEWLRDSGKTRDIVEGDGVILPGTEARYEIRADARNRRLSTVFMLVNTNDGFGGLDAVKLPLFGEAVHYVMAYDAGSERNTEAASDIPGPCCGSPGAGTPTHERIMRHAGIQGVGDLDPDVYGWTEPVARVTIRRLPPTYAIEIHNLTLPTVEGGSQVFSPPILAMHGPSVRMFRVGSFASGELSLIAEDGDTGPMLARLEGSRKVAAVITGDGPIPPGGSATYELEAAGPFSRLSLAFMLVNTNDGFSGVDRLRLPHGGSVSYQLRTWDAGSEQNTELATDIPGPCCGSPGQGPDEHLPIRPHPGIQGIGDLDPADYGWTDPAARLTITRIK